MEVVIMLVLLEPKHGQLERVQDIGWKASQGLITPVLEALRASYAIRSTKRWLHADASSASSLLLAYMPLGSSRRRGKSAIDTTMAPRSTALAQGTVGLLSRS